jgi:DNA helicase-2/ATP-dependent DNA helicase PcrA
MRKIEQLYFGPPGCGKTYTLMEVLRDLMVEDEIPPHQIGFCSFSRKAIQEARERAGSDLALTNKQTPHFRTLHSTCYHALKLNANQVMGSKDYKEIGRAMRHDLSFDADVDDSTGLTTTSNPYLRCIELARARQTDLEDEFRRMSNPNMYFSLLRQIDENIKIYKKENEKFDFADMLYLFAKGEGVPPEIDALIVDEAQDLTSLQWAVVRRLKQPAYRVYYAGDDDQAIHKWAGVEVSEFIDCTNSKVVLNQSYRVPRKVHSLAESIVCRIKDRYQKSWSPKEEEGSVSFNHSIWDLDLSQGSWTIMGRTNKLLQPIMKELSENGYLYEDSNGNTNISQSILTAKATWEDLVAGHAVNLNVIRELFEQMPKNNKILKRGAAVYLDTLDPEIPHTIDTLQQNDKFLATPNMPWFEVIKGVNNDTRAKFEAVLRREGSKGLSDPRIKVSTIHRMKGGEDDNIILLSDTSYAASKHGDIDDERRVFYTGVTRAKQNLHIIEPQTRVYFQELML